MKVLIVSGSRNPRGQTGQACEALADGSRGAGADVEIVYLPARAVERCRQCDEAGWGLCRQEGRCVIEDGFASIAAAIGEADAVVFATPVYFGDLSESLRAFLDRLRRTCTHESGKTGVAGKRAAGLCVAGGGGGGSSACLANMEKILQICGFDVVCLVPARRQNLQMKCEVLGVTGRWLVGE